MPIKPMNNILKWLVDMASLFSKEQITVPSDYNGQVIAVKDALKHDVTGLVNSLLDFSINTSLVKYSIESDNDTLTKNLNIWLDNLNSALRGKIPVGIQALAREYFRERWKGSSFLFLRTLWERKDGFLIPTRLWFVDGESLNIPEDDDETKTIGDEKYVLQITRDKVIPLPSKPNEIDFIQKPYSAWSDTFPTPFLIQRGLYKNLKFLELLENKGEFVVGKALEYLMLMKKGDKELAKTGDPNFVYDERDLSGIKDNFRKFVSDRKTRQGISTYVTNFDTEIQHLIPEYKRALESALYEPIEKRILAGFGLVEIASGIASDRREGILNPKPYISEINNGIKDFKMLLNDLVQTIMEKNGERTKFFSKNNKIKVVSSPVTEFITADVRDHLRSMYDRGTLSKRTYDELLGNGTVDFDTEVKRRKDEASKGLEDTLYPPVIQNKEADISPEEQKKFNIEPDDDEDETLEDRKPGTPEADNFGTEFEVAPFKTLKSLPKRVKDNMGKSLQRVWMNVFNSTFKRTGSDTRASKSAWSVISRVAKRNKDGRWVRMRSSALEEQEMTEIFKELLNLKKLELAGKHSEILNKFLEEIDTIEENKE